ncbi:glycosyltransferase family 2 protein [Nocardioides sp. LS1]|uniref:glycosyltransferase family 2 protein n=1 Tax=Nocardioides sp. LS1 TaxID=1027620 RepID=UPI000FFA6D3E|nr:glycosyltransferase family 2 protein [Nocardioides sp. LS1]GCD91335.1 glycosyl transferase [Nocardioides sp. LS1]
MVAPELALALSRSGGRAVPVVPHEDLGRASVVIPCYRYGHYLADAVRAALDQPGLAVEVIVVDDASPDDSGDVAEDLARDDERISVIRHRTNRGHIATYNDGLEAAGGDWVALVSADDLLTPGALTRAAALMAEHPGVGFTYGRARHFVGLPPTPRLEASHWVVWPGEAWLRARCRTAHNVIASPEVVVRGSVLRAVGGYRADLPHSGDLEMWMRVAAVSDVGYVVGPDQALYRQHQDNMHVRTFRADQQEGAAIDLRHRWAAFRAVLDDGGRPVLSGSGLGAVARRTLAAEALDLIVSARARGHDDRVVDDLVELWQELVPAPVAGRGRTLALGECSSLRSRSAWLPRAARHRLRNHLRWWRMNQVGV